MNKHHHSPLWGSVGPKLVGCTSALPEPGRPAVAVSAGITASLPPTPIQQRRKRGFNSDHDNGLAAVQLVDDDGVLRWVYQPPVQRQAGSRRAWRASALSDRDTVERYEFPELGENRVTEALERLDLRLNPARGLRQWTPANADHTGDGSWQPIAPEQAAALKGRVLLLIHGTFSESAMYDSELMHEPNGGAPAGGTPGQKLWRRLTHAGAPYRTVLAFDHATLSMAPWLNALMLVQALGGTQAEIDVLCHSRGGLVASWALRMSPLKFKQVIFVGSPLMGTSLAAPDRLRHALDLLTNVANAISVTSVALSVAIPPAAPLALGAAGLAQVLGRALHLGSSVPLVDAAVGLVPGLLSQSRVANNLELKELSLSKISATRLRGIGVVFQPDEMKEPAWKFWKRFSNLGGQALYHVGDVIFQQPNDLVVDLDSMNALGPKNERQIAPLLLSADWKHLGVKNTHHCSYFRDDDAIAQLEQWLV